MDYENFSPGPEITVKVKCNVQSHPNGMTHMHFHTFVVNVLDLNDNGPVEQIPNQTYEAKVDYPHFRKVNSAFHKLP